jgi:hypothetical protein
MKESVEGKLELLTGRKFDGYIIGIDSEFNLYEGYDCYLEPDYPDDWPDEIKSDEELEIWKTKYPNVEKFTSEEKLEIADYMIDLWNAFKENVKGRII